MEQLGLSVKAELGAVMVMDKDFKCPTDIGMPPHNIQCFFFFL